MNNKISRVIALVVIICAAVVIVGWIFDITFLKSISPNWVSMKFMTAISFVLSGIILYLNTGNDKKNNDWHDLVLAYTVYVLLLIVSGLTLSVFFGTRTGLEELFVKEEAGAVYTTMPGRPSIITLFAFFIVGVGGLFSLIKKEYCRRLLLYEAIALIIIGSVAIVGYITNFPPLFYQINRISTAVGFNTATLFILLGIGYLTCQKRKY